MRCSIPLLLLALRAVAVSTASPVSLATEGRGLRGAQRRPIITGCLEKCGFEDSACVTQCQVCVEQNMCQNLAKNCSVCVNEVNAALASFKAYANTTTDSGGASLVHEGIRQRLNHARLEAIDSFRELRRARRGVMHAQRQVEWAAAERKEEVRRLKKARAELEQREDEGKEWGNRKARALAESRKDVDKLQTDVNRTKRQIRRVHERLEKAKQRVAEAKDFASAGPHARVVVVVTRLEQRLRWKLRKQQNAVDKKMSALSDQEKDARWYQRGLKGQVGKMAHELKQQAQTLRAITASERVSRDQRRDAKNHYRDAVGSAQEWASEVKQLRTELVAHPIQEFDPSRSPESESAA